MTGAEFRKLALALPEASEGAHVGHADFRVGGKIFATMPPDNTHLHVFVGEEQREAALALYPESVEKLFWGKKACGLRIALDATKPAVVETLLRQAWAQRAPKRLLKNGE